MRNEGMAGDLTENCWLTANELTVILTLRLEVSFSN